MEEGTAPTASPLLRLTNCIASDTVKKAGNDPDHCCNGGTENKTGLTTCLASASLLISDGYNRFRTTSMASQVAPLILLCVDLINYASNLRRKGNISRHRKSVKIKEEL